MTLQEVPAKLVKGHGVASGKTKDSRFPQGTISMQLPYFRLRGLDLCDFYLGSLNLDISPYSFVLQRPDFSFSQVKWSPDLPAENFSFYSCILEPIKDGNHSTSYECYVYWPHPSTKPEFHKNPNVLEVIAPWIPNISYGDFLKLKCPNEVILFQK